MDDPIRLLQSICANFFSMDFDLESLVNVEQTFYESGFKDGFTHGRIHGSIEGRALGREKGFEMWEELGFYEGFALMWQAIHKRQGGNDDRMAHHIKHLLELIAQFPRVNPSATEPSDLDIPKLFRQIRSRYKLLCSTVGVRPTLRAAGSSAIQQGATGLVEQSGDVQQGGAGNVWPLQAADKPLTGEDLSF
ncbi:hypothetical protein AcW1_003184 [Taiwanofungus camphoratus]|nr:hypothetical protein AcW1_003184 [Antrodia cinnamomea]